MNIDWFLDNLKEISRIAYYELFHAKEGDYVSDWFLNKYGIHITIRNRLCGDEIVNKMDFDFESEFWEKLKGIATAEQ